MFYKSGLLYKPGDVVPSGNWGRVIQGMGSAHNRFWFEMLLETVRLDYYEGMLSRLNSAFTFEAVEVAVQFRANSREIIYEVEAVDDSPSVVLDMAWIDHLDGLRSSQAVQAAAKHYWAGDHLNEQWERLSSGPIRIVRRVTYVPDDGHAGGQG